MSKELIERLRNAAILATSECAWLMTEAADALEAKAAPVGEREAFEAYCQSIGYTLKTGDSGRYLGGYGAELWAGFKAGATHQRRQAREVVMPERKDDQGAPTVNLHIFREGWNACLDEFARLNKGGSHE